MSLSSLLFCSLSVIYSRSVSDPAKELYGAIILNDLDKVMSILASEVDVNIDLGGGKTPLATASYHRRNEIVEYLLSLKPYLESRDDNGYSALSLAVLANLGGNFSDEALTTVAILVAAGADVNAKINTLEDQYQTYLMAASERGNYAIAEKLLTQNADLRLRNNQGLCALSFALENRYDLEFQISRLLIAKRADVNGVHSNPPNTHLANAILLGKIDTVRFLLNNDAYPNIPDAFGKTALDHALENSNINNREAILTALRLNNALTSEQLAANPERAVLTDGAIDRRVNRHGNSLRPRSA